MISASKIGKAPSQCGGVHAFIIGGGIANFMAGKIIFIIQKVLRVFGLVLHHATQSTAADHK